MGCKIPQLAEFCLYNLLFIYTIYPKLPSFGLANSLLMETNENKPDLLLELVTDYGYAFIQNSLSDSLHDIIAESDIDPKTKQQLLIIIRVKKAIPPEKNNLIV